MVDYIKNYTLKLSPKGVCKGCIYHSGMDCNILVNNPTLDGHKIGCVKGDDTETGYFIITSNLKDILSKL